MQLEILSMKNFSWIIGGVKRHPPQVVYFAVLQKYIKELASEAATTAKQNSSNAHFSCQYLKYHLC